jgi:hypothetical protein
MRDFYIEQIEKAIYTFHDIHGTVPDSMGLPREVFYEIFPYLTNTPVVNHMFMGIHTLLDNYCPEDRLSLRSGTGRTTVYPLQRPFTTPSPWNLEVRDTHQIPCGIAPGISSVCIHSWKRTPRFIGTGFWLDCTKCGEQKEE